MTTPIGPGPESVGLQLYAPAPTSARWDQAVWDGGVWAAPAWQDVDCDVVEASFVRGVTDEAGVLSSSAAGGMDLATLDPNRELDPSNVSGPYFGAIAPGSPVRLIGGAAGSMVNVWPGWIDEATYDVATQRGKVRCVDAIAQLAQAQVPDGTVLPNTLRARVRAIVAAAGLGAVVPVADDVTIAQQLIDGGFENAAMPNWQLVGVGSGSGSVPYPGAYTGARVLTVHGGAGGFPKCIQQIPAEPGGSYRLTGWTRRNTGAGAFGSLLITPRSATGALVGGGPGFTSSLNDPTSWDPADITYVVPTDGSVATVEADLRVNASTTTASDMPLFDEVALTGPVAGTALPTDPPVAPFDGKAVSAWTAIQNAALDALVLVWLDPSGVLRFTSWGAFPDASVSFGCTPAGESPARWIGGLSTIQYSMAAAAIRNRVRAWSNATGPVWQPAAVDVGSQARYGARALDVERVVPDFVNWSARILADRGDAGLDVTLGELRPYNLAELGSLLTIGTTGPQVVRIHDDEHGTVIDQDVGIIGTAGRVTPAGWSFRYVTIIPRAEWDATDPTPPVPPIPPPDSYHQETRVYVATSDALLALTSGGSKYGAGASSSLPVGTWSGWTYRSCIQLPAIPWTKIRRIVSAKLRVTTTTQVRVGFGSSPTIEVQRITGSWSAGSSSSPSSGNAVVYPGPATTSSGAVRKNLPTSQGTAVDIDIPAIALAWAPASMGGSSAAQRGVMLLPGSGSGADTSEVWPVEQGGASRPQLTLVLEVFD